ncbi:MAG: HAD family hydrolase, partial [Actinomycetia bacterium]|nr:HAD family hydrolase [Actinomycetes bacterium]
MSRFDAITFDFWDTLVQADVAATRVQRRLAIVEVLESHGLPAEHDEIDASFDEAWKRFDSSWGLGEQFTGLHAAETVLEVLGHTDEQVRIRVIDAYLSAPSKMQLSLTDNLESTLRVLKAAGLRVGIVCDVGLTPSPVLRDYLEGHGILQLFDHWSFSDEVGVYKPNAAIFDHALAGLGGIDPTRAAHIGD